MKTVIPKISKRLEAAASFVRRGVRIADIGTDHAYLPIYLYASGIISGGVASDINQGPVDRARANIRGWGADGAIEVLRADGLCEAERYSPDDIFILGMGGELIANIIENASWVRDSRYRLILQPMTHAETLRKYLYDNQFSILDEMIVEDEKIYQIICAEYCGRAEEATPIELMFGKRNLERGGELLYRSMRRTRDIYNERIKGKRMADADISTERALIEAIDEILKGEHKNEHT